MGSNNQDVDISVTTFPGDVGGELMNINRWRQQIGLSPISIDSLDEHIVTKTINGMTYRIGFPLFSILSTRSSPRAARDALIEICKGFVPLHPKGVYWLLLRSSFHL